MLAVLTLAGCTGFDEFYLHDGFVYEAASTPPCGCAGAPRILPLAPIAPGPIQSVSGSAPVAQSREPELLR